MPRVQIFDRTRRTDMGGKRSTEAYSNFLNRSAATDSAAVRNLIESWLFRVPKVEQENLRSRFRSTKDHEFHSAFQELTFYELLRREGCEIEFHPGVTGRTKTPDFKVNQPHGSEFLLEACTSAKVSNGPVVDPRAGRIREFLGNLDLGGYFLAMQKLEVGLKDLRQRSLESHIRSAISNSKHTMSDGKISIPPYEIDGWLVRLTAYPAGTDGIHSSTLRMESWGSTWTGPTYPLLEALDQKSKRYGDQLNMPYVIAINSSDHYMEFNIKETLFGANQEVRAKHVGFWGTASNPRNRRVSAVLFTIGLFPPQLLMGHVYSRLYMNPWPNYPYEGVLTKLPTVRLENGALQEYLGTTQPNTILPKLLKLRKHDRAMWC